METANIITATRQFLTAHDNCGNIYNTLLDDNTASRMMHLEMDKVGNDQENVNIQEAWIRIDRTKINSRVKVQLAAQPQGKRTPELHCDLSSQAIQACDEADNALADAIRLFHRQSFRQHSQLAAGDIPQTVYEQEQAMYQAAMAHCSDSREVYQHLSSVWFDEHSKRVKRANSLRNRLGNWLKVLTPAALAGR